MSNILILLSLLGLSLQAIEIPTEHAKERAFGKKVQLNAQIVQLSNASQSIMSVVGGHIEKYYVKIGESVKNTQKIVLIESIVLSKMTAEFLSLKKQYSTQEKNFNATNELYKKGMTSMSALNEQSIKKDELLAKLTSLRSQLNTLGVDTKNLKKASSNFILYAHSDGVVSEILQPLHTSIKDDTPIISLVKNRAYYLKSFLPLKYARDVKVGQKIVVKNGDKNIISHITQILPKVDEQTQRIVLLSSIDEKASNLYINAYTEATLYFEKSESYVSVTKSALSFFNNEWVIFVQKGNHDEHEAHDGLEEHGEHEHEKHDGLETDDEHESHDEHGHDAHEEVEVPFEARVIEIVVEDENFVGVRGLSSGEEYASDKSYYIKSMMLKSSLGGHGH